MRSFEELMTGRRSTRGFLPTPVPPATLRAIFELAQYAPSNCNVQPWQTYVLSGGAREALGQELWAHAASGAPVDADFPLPNYTGEHRKRQIDCAAALYDSVSVRREDKVARATQMLRNFVFFGAPHVVLVTMLRCFGIPCAVDVGIYLQTLLLAMESHDVGCCAQGALTLYPDIVRKHLDLDEGMAILAGISFGYRDPDHPVNATRTRRAALADVVTFLGQHQLG